MYNNLEFKKFSEFCAMLSFRKLTSSCNQVSTHKDENEKKYL